MPQHLYKYFLGLLAATAPLATDMYLPAIPMLAERWQVPTSTVHLSLVLWFFAYGLMLLFWGSVSDRTGRRPILIIGLSLFIGASLLCAISQDVTQLIGARILQGIGAAGAAAMVMAIARERFEGQERKRTLAWVSVILGFAPMIAPTIGSAILEVASWRVIFIAQGSLAGVSLLATLFLYQETATITARKTSRIAGVTKELFARYGRLLHNPGYLLANGSTSLLSAPLLGFVAYSPVAFIVHFEFTQTQFAMAFGGNAAFVIIGSLICAKLVDRIDDRKLLSLAFMGCLVGGVLLLAFGAQQWLAFSTAMAIYSFFFGLSRPLVNHLVLDYVHEDFGAAASGLVSVQFLCGAAGMAIATAEWQQPFLVFGLLSTVCPVLTLILWPLAKACEQPDVSHC
ncbi:multidrug effflux MFS transporter [Rhodopirellula sp. MGV]|uniref:multidrug effflux MFS transporter n=1 Tax=Rhodopirellula sp. MGV TaxID=2023130 RepID=UPI000B9740B0|nr:multidrug effflux MFS transporter [Rhodopirellula sp. MGV]OYP28269.1 hypothetical protein CGZ80_25950 [Rhodopirellula sp. MGV]PNY38853.1 MFS transporter [Rhodopirellula baltica]